MSDGQNGRLSSIIITTELLMSAREKGMLKKQQVYL